MPCNPKHKSRTEAELWQPALFEAKKGVSQESVPQYMGRVPALGAVQPATSSCNSLVA